MPTHAQDRSARADLVKELAREIGFDLVGITALDASLRGTAYREWIAAGKHGRMDYLAKNIEQRLDPRLRFPWVRSVICVALAYWQETPPPAPSADAAGKIARYAWGRDYHRVLTQKLRALETKLHGIISEGFDARTYVDTGPLLERELAAHAGLGWIGKHTLLIHPKHGSYFVLGELLTSLDLPLDSGMADHCGTCTRCIQACPTDAITPYSVDATKCISYQTLENRGDIPAELHGPMADAGYLIGCDICQDVCPFNRTPLPTREPDFAPQSPAPVINLPQITAMDEATWDQMTRGKAHRRAKFGMWQRNAEILATARSGD